MRTSAVLAACAVTLAACSDTPTRPDASARIDFGIAAGEPGHYFAAGSPSGSRPATLLASSFAAAMADSVGGLVVVGFQPTDPQHGDVFILQVRATSPGTYTCAGPLSVGEGCYGELMTGVARGDPAPPDRIFWITDGQVSLSTVGTRVAGTLQLSLAADDTLGADTIAVSDGTFDVPMSDASVSGGLQCLIAYLLGLPMPASSCTFGPLPSFTG